MYKIFITVLLVISGYSISAQLLPPNRPEQDPCNALEICGNFYTPYSYQGIGYFTNLTSCSCDYIFPGGGTSPVDEENSVWFKLTINTPGDLIFKIIPVLSTDDYDWAVFDGNGILCSALSGSDVIRCNFNNNNPVSMGGQTGLNLTSIETSVQGGVTGHNFCKKIDANVGDVYYIMVNNFGSPNASGGYDPSQGFTLDFSGSIATFNQPAPPQLDSILSPICGNEITIKLDQVVKCSSIASNGSDFSIAPTGTIISAVGSDCVTGGYTDEITLTLNAIQPSGNYTIKAKVGTDGNTLLNLCDVPLELPDSLNFVMPNYIDTVKDTICSGYMPYVWNGITVSDSGTAVASFQNTAGNGCDSLVILNLTLVESFHTYENISVCSYDMPYNWYGKIINSGGMAVADTIFYSLGNCDSTVTLNLTVNEAYPTTNDTAIADCGQVTIDGMTFTRDTTYVDTLYYVNGCDSVYNVYDITVWYNEATVDNLDFYGCDSFTYQGIKFYNDTIIVDSLSDVHGCDSFVIRANIHISHFELNLTTENTFITEGEYINLNTSANEPYSILSWSPASLFPNQIAKEQLVQMLNTQTIVTLGKNDYGCLDTAKLTIDVDPLVPEYLMPSAFSPNGDGDNDVFMPVFANEGGHVINNFNIYNRWGNLVYKLDNTKNGGWNGYINGKYAEQDVYYYIITVTFSNGKKETKKGDVTLIR